MRDMLEELLAVANKNRRRAALAIALYLFGTGMIAFSVAAVLVSAAPPNHIRVKALEREIAELRKKTDLITIDQQGAAEFAVVKAADFS